MSPFQKHIKAYGCRDRGWVKAFSDEESAAKVSHFLDTADTCSALSYGHQNQNFPSPNLGALRYMNNFRFKRRSKLSSWKF